MAYPKLNALLIALIAASAAQADPASIAVSLREYGASSSVTPTSFKATIDGQAAVTKLESSQVTIFMPAGAKRLAISANAGQGYRERTIAMFSSAVQPEREYVFIIEKRRDEYTRDYLSEGLNRLDRARDPDAALALFDNAYKGGIQQESDTNAYEATLRYNYGRALQQTCFKLGFDTCDDAKQILQEILTSLQSSSRDRKIYGSVHVNDVLIQQALADLASHEVGIPYSNFKEAIAAKNFEGARVAIDAIAKLLDSDPKSLQSQGLTAAKIAKDRAYLRRLSVL
ncbi:MULTISPECIES: hypothetical protein [unclassified Variovorax]|uniref:hypothetical protein n=1 Tax=unclassified Variovorax TaxID=663243 RepID=UPI0008B1D9CD|nr:MULTISPECIES: hypothetical protein [unclassified Variovorax]SEK10698.1 hypothetical protein SAMN05518853_109259 [Variovorax sp. OK202]SFD69426.1 hypothetical protein SAMN05444746_109259 [Variovorax sp. OK212]